jgi:hypothetical protein
MLARTRVQTRVQHNRDRTLFMEIDVAIAKNEVIDKRLGLEKK